MCGSGPARLRQSLYTIRSNSTGVFMQSKSENRESFSMMRRSFLSAGIGAAIIAPRAANAQRDWSGKDPVRYPDPDIIVRAKRFSKYKIRNTRLQRRDTRTRRSEAPAGH